MSSKSVLCTNHKSWIATRLGEILEWFNWIKQTQQQRKKFTFSKVNLERIRDVMWRLQSLYLSLGFRDQKWKEEKLGAVVKSWSLPQRSDVTTANRVTYFADSEAQRGEKACSRYYADWFSAEAPCEELQLKVPACADKIAVDIHHFVFSSLKTYSSLFPGFKNHVNNKQIQHGQMPFMVRWFIV